MISAHGAMAGVQKLLAWANVMYDRANKVGGEAAPYQIYQGMAAANSGFFFTKDPAMALPPALLQERREEREIASSPHAAATLLHKGRG